MNQQPLVLNPKWGQFVNDFTFGENERWLTLDAESQLIHFENLRKFAMNNPGFNLLSNGQITSYLTLKELTLCSMTLPQDTISEIRKFTKLEVLSLQRIAAGDSNTSSVGHLDPIPLRKLKEFSFDTRK